MDHALKSGVHVIRWEIYCMLEKMFFLKIMSRCDGGVVEKIKI